MTKNSFCINCGTGLEASSKFCGKCGHSVGGAIEIQPTDLSTNLTIDSTKTENDVLGWVGLALGLVIGVPAFLSVIDLPAEATYVTFNLTLDNILKGGWYTWYSGALAFSMKTMIDSGFGSNKSGMDASTFRTILWIVTGLCVGMAWPAIKNGLRKFIKDVTN